MKNIFSYLAAPIPRTPLEELLTDLGCRYKRKSNGIIVVQGDLSLARRNLTELPDLSQVVVTGMFSCSGNKLTSLKGAPLSVGASFYCFSNQLTSLEGGPQSVGGSYSCDNNQLTSLKGCPASVGHTFSCNSNRLTSLEGGPQSAGWEYICENNFLVSLKGAPRRVNFFHAGENPLRSLAGAPEGF